MNDLQIFNNDEFGNIRTVYVDGQPLFVATDVAKALGYLNPNDAISRHCKGIVKRDTPTSSGIQQMSYINEGNVYRLIMKSKLPSAERFESWVMDEVLPTIRKTGGYHLPSTYKEALQELLLKVEENEKLMLENEEMKPKADFFDTVAESKTAISMNEVAKVLDMGIGRNKLFEFLREDGVLDRRNVPYQKFVDAGWFRVIEQSYMRNSEPVITTKTLVYQKGVDGIRKRLIKARNE